MVKISVPSILVLSDPTMRISLAVPSVSPVTPSSKFSSVAVAVTAVPPNDNPLVAIKFPPVTLPVAVIVSATATVNVSVLALVVNQILLPEATVRVSPIESATILSWPLTATVP